MITSDQIRAARALLRWSGKDLAEKTGLGFSTLMRLEVLEGVPTAQAKTLETIQKAFEKSSNVIAAVINKLYRSDPDMFMKRLEEFGLLEPMGIDLEGEGAPQFHRPGETLWSPLSIPWMSIGYEYRQTPLQTLAFYNAVANNGKFLKPLFVQDIRRRGKVIKHFKPVVLKERIASQKTIDIMKMCLEGVMTVGTGSDLKSSQFKIAGKTGTAKLPGKDKRYADANHSVFQASFAGYFPADKPKYSCVVVITDPKTEYYGARLSGTVFAAVANQTLKVLFFYHEGDNPYRIKERLDALAVAHQLDPTCYVFVSSNSAAQNIPGFVAFQDSELWYYQRNHDNPPLRIHHSPRDKDFTVLARTHKWWRGICNSV